MILKSWKTSATIAAYLQHVHDCCRSIVNPKAPVNKFRPCFFFSSTFDGSFTLQCKSVFMASPSFYQLFNKEALCTFQKCSLVFVEFPRFFGFFWEKRQRGNISVELCYSAFAIYPFNLTWGDLFHFFPFNSAPSPSLIFEIK